MGDDSVEPKPTVVVTVVSAQMPATKVQQQILHGHFVVPEGIHKIMHQGFGPFGHHHINASWVAVQELEKMGLGDEANLVTMEIPVNYDHVKTEVPNIWKHHKPKLMVHVGVSGIAKELTLEQQAHNDGYDKYDMQGAYPKTMCCVQGGADCLVSKLDMQKVCSAVNDAKCGVEAIVSLDPGRYLCDYIYYTSLNQDSNCSAFIHVPPLDKPYTAVELAKGINIAIMNMLQQLQ